MLLAVFFLFGGETLQRFQPRKSASAEAWTGLRPAMQADALALANTAPWTGQGLGNFEALFGVSTCRARYYAPNHFDWSVTDESYR